MYSVGALKGGIPKLPVSASDPDYVNFAQLLQRTGQQTDNGPITARYTQECPHILYYPIRCRVFRG